MKAKNTGLVTALGVACLVAPTPAHAGITFYSTRLAFNSAAPGRPIEGFQNAVIPAGEIYVESNPISSTTNDSIFSTGSVFPGITVNNANTDLSPGLVVYGAGAIAAATACVGTNWFGDAIVLSFTPGVNSVGTDVFAAAGPGQTLAGSFTENVYSGTQLLASKSFTETAGQLGFIGVISSSTNITSVSLLYTTTDASTFVDNVAFGSINAVPEPLALITLGLGVVALLRSSRLK